jgi:hypothetical protein
VPHGISLSSTTHASPWFRSPLSQLMSTYETMPQFWPTVSGRPECVARRIGSKHCRLVECEPVMRAALNRTGAGPVDLSMGKEGRCQRVAAGLLPERLAIRRGGRSLFCDLGPASAYSARDFLISSTRRSSPCLGCPRTLAGRIGDDLCISVRPDTPSRSCGVPAFHVPVRSSPGLA